MQLLLALDEFYMQPTNFIFSCKEKQLVRNSRCTTAYVKTSPATFQLHLLKRHVARLINFILEKRSEMYCRS